MKEKKSNNLYGPSCFVLILLAIVILLVANFMYESYDTKSDVAESSVIAEVKPIVKDLFEIGIDEKSEEEAISAIRFLAEAQQRYFVHTSQLKHYASSIEELGFMGDGKGGNIASKPVWAADANAKKPIPLGRTKSEYSVKILPSNDPTCEVGYIALAIPLKEKLAMYVFCVDEAHTHIMQTLVLSAYRIFDAKTIKELKSNNFISKKFLEELSEDLDKVQLVHKFKLPINIKNVK